MISLPIPMALESFLRADILNILLHHWEKKNSKGRSSFRFMTRLLLHQRESYSTLWNSSHCAASDIQGEELEKSNSSRALQHAESSNKPCVGSQTPLIAPHWWALSWHRHQNCTNTAQLHQRALLCSSSLPKTCWELLLLWSSPQPAQLRVWHSLGSEL